MDSAYYGQASEILSGYSEADNSQWSDSLKVAFHTTSGRVLRRLGEYDLAMIHLSRAQKTAEKIYGGRHFETAEIYMWIGYALRDQGNPAKALFWLKKARHNSPVAREAPFQLLGNIHNGIGSTLLKLGKEEEGLKHLHRAIEINESHPPRLSTSCPYDNLGGFYADKRDFRKAILYFEKALEIKKGLLPSSSLQLAYTYRDLIQAYSESGDLEKCLELEGKALQVFKNKFGENHEEVAWSYANLAFYSWASRTNLEKGIENAQKSISIFKATEQEYSRGCGLAYNHLGICFSHLGELDKAIDAHKKALNIRIRALGRNDKDVGASYNNLGVSYGRKGDYETALDYYQRFLDNRIYYCKYYHPYTGLAFNNMAYCLMKLDRHDEALAYLEKSSEVYSSPKVKGHFQEYLPYTNLGWYYLEKGNYAKSLGCYRVALRIAKGVFFEKNPVIAGLFLDVASVFIEQNELGKAKTYIDSAYFSINYLEGSYEFDAAVVDRIKLLDVLFLEAIVLEEQFKKTGSPKILEKLKENRKQAVTLIDYIAANLSEASSRSVLLGKNYQSYEKAIWAALQLAPDTRQVPEKPFKLAEKSKALLLLESYYKSKAQAVTGLPDSLLEKENQLKQKIAYYEKRAFDESWHQKGKPAKPNRYSAAAYELKQEYRSLQKEIEQQYPDYFDLRYNFKVASLQKVQAALHPRQGLIEYFVGDDNLFLFLIRRDTLIVRSQVMDAAFPLEQWVEDLRKGLGLAKQ